MSELPIQSVGEDCPPRIARTLLEQVSEGEDCSWNDRLADLRGWAEMVLLLQASFAAASK